MFVGTVAPASAGFGPRQRASVCARRASGEDALQMRPAWWRSSSSSDPQTAWWRHRWVAPTSRRRRRPGPDRPGLARAVRTRLRAAPCLLAPSWYDAARPPAWAGHARTRRILARRPVVPDKLGPNFPTTLATGASIRPDSLNGAATATPHRGATPYAPGVSLFVRLGVLVGAIALVAVACVVPPMMATGGTPLSTTHAVSPHPTRPGPRPGPCLQSTQCAGSGALLLSGGAFGSPLLAAPLLVASSGALGLLVRRLRRRHRDLLPAGVHVLVLRPPRALSPAV